MRALSQFGGGGYFLSLSIQGPDMTFSRNLDDFMFAKSFKSILFLNNMRRK
jgi:hypothetical protein